MAETQDSTLWSILIIPKDDTGLAVYLKEYKPFRLLALECDPSGKPTGTWVSTGEPPEAPLTRSAAGCNQELEVIPDWQFWY